jgi:hypothetical protein
MADRRNIVWPDNAVWLASYPRSGNTYLRAILWSCFGLRSGSVYPDDLQSDLAVAEHVGHFEGAAHGLFSADFLRLPLIKTHEWPSDDRKAIYIVRDGRASCRSFWEFLHASGYDLSLDDVIAGRLHFGSWSGHLLAWDPAARPNTLLLRFEELTTDFAGTLERLAQFLELRPVSAEPPKLVAARDFRPHWLSPEKKTAGALTPAQETLFRQVHGETMIRFGYDAQAASDRSANVVSPLDKAVATNAAVVWLCWGEEYLEEARESALTTMPLGIDRLLITDADMAKLVERDGVFTTVIPAELPYGSNINKSRLIDLIPAHYESILYLDSDTRVLGDVSLGFEKARQHGIAIAPAPHYNLSEFFGFNRVLTQHGLKPAGQMQYNAGVIFCHLSGEVRKVLSCWRDLCHGAAHEWTNDQPFLTLAFEQSGFQPYVLSPLYNYRSLGELAVGQIRIWHSHHLPPLDLNDGETAWPPRRFQEGVRVPW